MVLLPHLRALEWQVFSSQSKNDHLPATLLCMGPELTRLELNAAGQRIPPPEHVLCASLEMMATCFPRMEDFTLLVSDRGVSYGMETSLALSRLIPSYSSWASFDCTSIPLTVDAIKFLSTLPTLHRLSMQLPENADWSPLKQIPLPFAPLAAVVIAGTMQAYIDFAPAVSLTHLEDLTFWVLDDEVASHLLNPFFAAIRHQCSPARLHRLFVEADYDRSADGWASQAVVRPDNIRTLLDFVAMKHCDLALLCHAELDAQFLQDLAKAWPQLVELSLLCEDYCIHDSLPPLSALSYFAIHCRDLDNLNVVVDAASEELEIRDLSEFGGKASTSELSTLVMGASPIGDPAVVAALIVRMFPSVVEVLCSSNFPMNADNGQQFEDRWSLVRDTYLPMLEVVRRDERRRIEQEAEDEDTMDVEAGDEGEGDGKEESSEMSM